MPLNFTEERTVSDGREAVSFMAVDADSDRQVPCVVTREALMDYAGKPDAGADLGAMFDVHRAAIFAAADIKRMRGQTEPDGSILVTSEDLAR